MNFTFPVHSVYVKFRCSLPIRLVRLKNRGTFLIKLLKGNIIFKNFNNFTLKIINIISMNYCIYKYQSFDDNNIIINISSYKLCWS